MKWSSQRHMRDRRIRPVRLLPRATTYLILSRSLALYFDCARYLWSFLYFHMDYADGATLHLRDPCGDSLAVSPFPSHFGRDIL